MLLKQRGDANGEHLEREGKWNWWSAATLPSPLCYGCPSAVTLRLEEGSGLWKLAALEVWRCSSVKTGQIKLVSPQQLRRYGTRLPLPCTGKRREPAAAARATRGDGGGRFQTRQQLPRLQAPAGPRSPLLFRTPAPRLAREAAGEGGPHLGATPVSSRGSGAEPLLTGCSLSAPGGLPRRGDWEPQLSLRLVALRCPTPGCAGSAPPQTHRNTPQQPLPAINPSEPQQPPPPSTGTNPPPLTGGCAAGCRGGEQLARANLLFALIGGLMRVRFMTGVGSFRSVRRAASHWLPAGEVRVLCLNRGETVGGWL